MNIFESLEQLNVSEECFDDIVEIVERKIADTIGALKKDSESHPTDAQKFYDYFNALRGVGKHQAKQIKKMKADTKKAEKDLKQFQRNKYDASFNNPLDNRDEGPDDYGQQFVPVKRQYTGDDYDIRVAKYGN